MAGRTTIRELAKCSGVSVGTVSRALNGYPDLAPETRARIVRLAAELEYTPAAAARTLATRRSHVVGVFLETGGGHPDLRHPFFHEVVDGLKHALGEGGFDLLLFAAQPPGSGFADQTYLNRCHHRGVDGVVLMGMDSEDLEARRLARSDVPCVGVDVDRGSRSAIQARRLAYRDEYVVYGDYYVDSGRDAMEQLLALDEPPTGLVVQSDLMAVGAIGAATAAGLRVPDDLSVVGFDDVSMAPHMRPALTTIHQHKVQLGREAGAALLRRIDSSREQPATVTLPVELIVRDSTAPPGGIES